MVSVLRQPIKQDIFEFLHERIIAGKYAPGEWLRQEDISSQLGVSMTPVREALDLLVSAGLAERVPYRGVRVLQPTQNEILDSYAMRLILESTAAFAAAQNISQEQLDKLEEILDESKSLVELKNMSKQRVLNRELHTTIVTASGNALLYKMYITILNTFPDWMLYEYMFRHPELLSESISKDYCEHRAIVEALAARNPALAVQKTIEHVTSRSSEMETYLGVPLEMIAAKESQILPLLVKQIRS
jgi:DNA-binding GntR family transcriptional regulator